jgi:hypothetical protein
MLRFAIAYSALCTLSLNGEEPLQLLREKSRAEAELIRSAIVKSIDDAIHDKNNAVAFFAAYKKLILQNDTISKSQIHLGKFIGILTARLESDVPDWWMKTIFESKPQHNIFLRNSTFDYVRSGRYSLNASKRYRLVEEKLMLSQNAIWDRAKFEKIIHTAHSDAEVIDLLKEKQFLYIAAASNAAKPYKISRINLENDELSWTAEVHASLILSPGGSHFHNIEIVSSSDNIIIYGAEPGAVYIEVFSKSNGKRLYGFHSSLWSRN